MIMRDKPICFSCEQEIDEDPVFDSACGHKDCLSVVFHPVCLMDWRESREIAMKMMENLVDMIEAMLGDDHE